MLVDGAASPAAYPVRPVGTPTGPFSVARVRQLTPATTRTLSVRAVDAAGNTSAAGPPLTVTTEANSDTVAPTAPQLTSAFSGGTGYRPDELWLRWQPSTDDTDAPAEIEHEIRVNGTILEVIRGGARTITYTEFAGPDVAAVVAVDRAGNASAPSNSARLPVSWGTPGPG